MKSTFDKENAMNTPVKLNGKPAHIGIDRNGDPYVETDDRTLSLGATWSFIAKVFAETDASNDVPCFRDWRYQMKIEMIKAKDIKIGDTIMRFGFKLMVLNVSERQHPMCGRAIEITHEAGTVNYTPNKMVERIIAH